MILYFRSQAQDALCQAGCGPPPHHPHPGLLHGPLHHPLRSQRSCQVCQTEFLVSKVFTLFSRSHSILVGRPQFGSRPNLYKTTSTTEGRSTLKHLGGRNRERTTLSSKIYVARTDDNLQRRKLDIVLMFPCAHISDRVQKMRKMVRPRLKLGESGARQARHVPAEREEEGQAADSTTESDEPGKHGLSIL